MVKLVGRTGDTVSLFADEKSEVVDGMTVEGMNEGESINAGSDVMTSSGEMAFMKSTGDWNWL